MICTAIHSDERHVKLKEASATLQTYNLASSSCVAIPLAETRPGNSLLTSVIWAFISVLGLVVACRVGGYLQIAPWHLDEEPCRRRGTLPGGSSGYPSRYPPWGSPGGSTGYPAGDPQGEPQGDPKEHPVGAQGYQPGGYPEWYPRSDLGDHPGFPGVFPWGIPRGAGTVQGW